MNRDSKGRFFKGFTPWNKGLKGTQKGERNGMWRGDKVGYNALHSWVNRRLGKAVKCSLCLSTKKVELANKSHEYKRDLTDWIQLCSPCHRSYDRPTWGSSVEKYKELLIYKPRKCL